jgi:hypothetical protein
MRAKKAIVTTLAKIRNWLNWRVSILGDLWGAHRKQARYFEELWEATRERAATAEREVAFAEVERLKLEAELERVRAAHADLVTRYTADLKAVADHFATRTDGRGPFGLEPETPVVAPRMPTPRFISGRDLERLSLQKALADRKQQRESEQTQHS